MVEVVAWNDSKSGDVFPLDDSVCPATLTAEQGPAQEEFDYFVDIVFNRSGQDREEDMIRILLETEDAVKFAQEILKAVEAADRRFAEIRQED